MELLFRGKRKDNGEWVEGGLIQCGLYKYILIPAEEHLHLVIRAEHEDIAMEVVPVILETLGMYTGRLDKNGKEIFAGIGEKGGDIVKANYSCPVGFDCAPHKLTGAIEWSEDDCCWMFDYCHGSLPLSAKELDDIEVIGTVADSPELLEG